MNSGRLAGPAVGRTGNSESGSTPRWEEAILS